jgi:hypothetical protein
MVENAETIKPPTAVNRWRPDQSEDPPEVSKPPDPQPLPKRPTTSFLSAIRLATPLVSFRSLIVSETWTSPDSPPTTGEASVAVPARQAASPYLRDLRRYYSASATAGPPIPRPRVLEPLPALSRQAQVPPWSTPRERHGGPAGIASWLRAPCSRADPRYPRPLPDGGTSFPRVPTPSGEPTERSLG